MGKASEIWKEIKPKIGEMLMVVNIIETQAEKAQEEAYQHGLNDAWEAARWVSKSNAGINFVVFGKHFTSEILQEISASEVIEEIRAYEQAQKEKEKQDGLRQNIQTIVDQCGYTLDEIAEVLAKMKEASDG